LTLVPLQSLHYFLSRIIRHETRKKDETEFLQLWKVSTTFRESVTGTTWWEVPLPSFSYHSYTYTHTHKHTHTRIYRHSLSNTHTPHTQTHTQILSLSYITQHTHIHTHSLTHTDNRHTHIRIAIVMKFEGKFLSLSVIQLSSSSAPWHFLIRPESQTIPIYSTLLTRIISLCLFCLK